MYLAGYSIECKLKVRLMEMFSVWTLQDLETELERLGQVPDVFTHSIEVLLGLTGVRNRVGQDRGGTARLHYLQLLATRMALFTRCQQRRRMRDLFRRGQRVRQLHR